MGIRGKLVLGFSLFGIGPLAVIALLSYRLSSTALVEAYDQILRQQAAASQTRLDLLLERWRAQALSWAGSEATRRSFETGDDKFVVDFIGQQMQLQPEYRVVLVLDAKRQVVAVYARDGKGSILPKPSLAKADLSRAAWVPKHGNTPAGESVVMMTARGDDLLQWDGETDAWLLVPAVITDEFDDPLGLWINCLPLTAVAELTFGAISSEQRDRYTAVFDREGTLLFSSLPAAPAGLPGLGALLGARSADAHGTLRGRGFDGHPAMVNAPRPQGFPALEAVGWRLAAVATEAGALRPVHALARTVLIASVALIVIAVILALILAGRQVGSITALTDLTAHVIATGDLTQRIEVAGTDEVGLLGVSFQQMIEHQRSLLRRMRKVTSDLSRLTEDAARVGRSVATGAEAVQEQVTEASRGVQDMVAARTEVDRRIDTVRDSAQRTAAAVTEMATAHHAVVENAQAMFTSVEETSSAIEDIGESVRTTAASIASFNVFIEQTSSTMSEMEHSMRDVMSNAAKTVTVSDAVAQDAEQGSIALRESLHGIEAMSDSFRTVSAAVLHLSEEIKRVDSLVDIIGGIAQQTNLLALNAAILAAQAGDRGKGFAVVAEQIKSLADRTRSSTEEAAGLIGRIRAESSHADAAVVTGMHSIDEGRRLGDLADKALQKILTSSASSSSTAKAIAAATEEGVRRSTSLSAAVRKIVDTVQDLRTVSASQAERAEQILRAIGRMKQFTSQVRRSTEEQAEGANQILLAAEETRQMVDYLERAQRDQITRSEKVLAAISAIASVFRDEAGAVAELVSAVESLHKHAEAMDAEVRRFQTTRSTLESRALDPLAVEDGLTDR